MRTKPTIGAISRAEAERISPEYARFAADGDWSEFGAVAKAFRGLRHWQRVVTHRGGEFVVARVASVGRGRGGPAVRVSDGESIWRVDGDRWAFPAD